MARASKAWQTNLIILKGPKALVFLCRRTVAWRPLLCFLGGWLDCCCFDGFFSLRGFNLRSFNFRGLSFRSFLTDHASLQLLDHVDRMSEGFLLSGGYVDVAGHGCAF